MDHTEAEHQIYLGYQYEELDSWFVKGDFPAMDDSYTAVTIVFKFNEYYRIINN